MKHFVSLVVVFSIAGACKQTKSSNAALSAKSSTTQHLTGSAYLIAPIVKAHVKVSRLASGSADELLIEDKTDDKGRFDLTLPVNSDGDLLIEIVGDHGGTTIEPLTGVDPISLSESDDLMAVALGTHLGGQTQVVVNPLSTLVSARALSEYRAGASLATAYAKDSALFSAHFQTATPWLSAPVDLLSTAAPGLSSGVIYSLAVTGLSQHAFALGQRASVTDVSVVNTLVVLRQLVADISSPTDRIFDGKRGGKPLNITGNVFIDQETTRLSLATSIETFLASTGNKSGLAARDVTQVTNAIRQDVSELYSGSSQNTSATGQSGAPPIVSITAPQANQTLGTANSIVGFAQDSDGIGTLSILIDGTQVGVTFDKTDPTKWTFAFVPSLASGLHTLEVDADDTLGNASQQQVQFAFDDQPPAIGFVDCTSPDDRTRTATVSLAGVTYAGAANTNPCSETTLNSAVQAVYEFADLYEQGIPVTQIRLSVTDQSAIASVAFRVETNGVEVRAPQPLSTATAPATHAFSIDLATLGLAAGALHAGDITTIQIIAVDQSGNKSTRDFPLHVNLIPTPLNIQSTAPDSATSLQGHTFALGNIYQLFDAELPFVELARFVTTNVSKRPTTMTTAFASATTGTMDLVRWAYRTYYFDTQTFPRNPNGPCAEITEVTGTAYGDSPPFAPQWSTQKCYSIGHDFNFGKHSQTLTSSPALRVYELPSNKLLAGDAVTLEPGKQYAVILGTVGMSVPLNVTNLADGFPWNGGGGSSDMSAYFMGWETDLTRHPLDYDNDWTKTQAAGFLRFNIFAQTPSTATFSLWGAADGKWATRGWAYIYSPGLAIDAIYNPATGLNHFMSPIVLERGVELTGDLQWTVPLGMSATDPAFVGTGNHQPTAAFTHYFDQPVGVTLCPWTNPLCNVDLSGW